MSVTCDDPGPRPVRFPQRTTAVHESSHRIPTSGTTQAISARAYQFGTKTKVSCGRANALIGRNRAVDAAHPAASWTLLCSCSVSGGLSGLAGLPRKVTPHRCGLTALVRELLHSLPWTSR